LLRRFLSAVCLAVILWPQCAFAQFRIQQFTSSNGLPQNTVASIAQTRDGYLWIATYDGLVRYDGVTFTIFDKGNTPALAGNRFLAVYVDGEGVLWGGTVEAGLVRYTDGAFKTYGLAQGLTSTYIGRLQDGPRGLIAFYEGEKPAALIARDGTITAAGDDVQSEFVDRAGRRWTRRQDGLLREANGSRELLPVFIEPNEFARFRYEDSGGNLWIGTRRAGMYRISGTTVERFAEKEGVPTDAVLRIAGQDPDGAVWFANERVLLKYAAGRIDRFDIESLIGGPARVAFVDREGTLWLGSNADGLFRLAPPVVTTFTPPADLGPIIYPVISDTRGDVWAGSGNALTRISRGTVTAMRTDNGVNALALTKAGVLLVAVGRQIFETDGARLVSRGPPFESTINAIVEAADGALWVGTGHGLHRLQNGQVAQHVTPEDGLPDWSVNVLHLDRTGALWVGTQKGLARWDGSTLKIFSSREGLVGERIRALYEDADGTLWIGTFDSGLSRMKNGRFTNYTTTQGLYSNGVFGIAEDSAGNFWISCNRGIYRVQRAQLNAVADGAIRRVHSVAYGTQDGMLSSECNGGRQPSVARTPDGRLWFPTRLGVAMVDPAAASRNTQPPAVAIESVLVNETDVNWREGVRVPADQRDLQINYSAPSSIKAEHVQFKYRLAGRGVSDAWVDAGTRRSVHYSYLPHGRYEFTVIAANSDGVWNERGATFAVTIEPRFYETRWFIVLCVLAGAVAVGTYYVLRVRRLERNERRLTQLVEERTAELRERSAQLEVANTALEELATIDTLTGVANRRRLDVFLQQEWQRAFRAKQPLSLLLVDADHFKSFNDTYGHQPGDETLRKIAQVLRTRAHRVSDLAARYGGEEFAVVLANTDAAGAAKLAEGIRADVEALAIPHTGAKRGVVTVSIGQATRVEGGYASVQDLIAACDRALYEAKHRGRNQVVAAE
jgi:diguanylate cyclase (GGDEF)-like protein